MNTPLDDMITAREICQCTLIDAIDAIYGTKAGSHYREYILINVDTAMAAYAALRDVGFIKSYDAAHKVDKNLIVETIVTKYYWLKK